MPRSFLLRSGAHEVYCFFQYARTWLDLDATDDPLHGVTLLSAAEADPRHLYVDLYCARDGMENRIKECQLELFADRTSRQIMRERLLKVGTHIRITVRKIWVTFSESFPAGDLFRKALGNIRATPPVAGVP